MKVIFLGSLKTDQEKRLQRVLEHILPRKNINYVRTVKELEDNLRELSHKITAVAILQVGKEKLLHLLPIKELFEDTSIILILNNKDEETIALGHRLRPRFITYADSDFLDVASVLIKMKEKMFSEEVQK
jgi:hypothetical protein